MTSFILAVYLMDLIKSLTIVLTIGGGCAGLVCFIFMAMWSDTKDEETCLECIKYIKRSICIVFICLFMVCIMPGKDARTFILVGYGTKLLTETPVAGVISDEVLLLYKAAVDRLKETIEPKTIEEK